MSRFRTRFCVYLATSTFLGVFIALRVSGQDSPPTARKHSGDDSQAAAGKTGGGGDASSKDVSKDQDDDAKDSSQKADRKTKATGKAEEEFVRKTDAEWRKILTRVQYMVTRQKATEPAFSGKYATGHFRGTFLCVCCDAEVFNAQNKFDSGTGWPSFDRPASARAIGREMEYSAFEPRVEVMCRRCGAHLGHIFDDGPTITGLRFCINSAAIKLRPPEGESDSSKASSRTASKGRPKTRAKSSAKSKAKSKAPQQSGDSQESPGIPEADRRSAPAVPAKPSPDPSR